MFISDLLSTFVPLEQLEADESDDVEKNNPVGSRRKFCLDDLDKKSEARKRFV